VRDTSYAFVAVAGLPQHGSAVRSELAGRFAGRRKLKEAEKERESDEEDAHVEQRA
jgi:hypothetical protein